MHRCIAAAGFGDGADIDEPCLLGVAHRVDRIDYILRAADVDAGHKLGRKAICKW